MRSSGALTGSNNVWKDGELVASMNWLDFGPIVPRYRKITSQIPRYNPIASQPKIPLLERSHRTLALFQDIGHLSRSSEVFVRSEVSGSPGGLYSTYQNTSSSPALGHISPRTTSSIIFARQKSISTGSIISDNEATEPLPGFPGTAEQFGKIRNSIANGFILRDPDEEQEIWVLNAMQEMRTEAEEVAIHQGDVSEYFSIVEPGCLDLHTRSECSASWSSPQPSPTSLPSEVEIDPQLLRGVCGSFRATREHESIADHFDPSFAALEFNPPQISIAKTTLKGGVPNVISLPTGRFVPFHIQAPGWRHFLKMMAQLSGTRVEAFIEAPADSEQELKLRTVVQFVRVRVRIPSSYSHRQSFGVGEHDITRL